MDIAAALGAGTDQADEWSGVATVTNTAAGALPDGRLLIGIRLNGADLVATYLSSYTPATGDQVTYLKKGTSLFVLGSPAMS